MIQFVSGDIFDHQADIRVNTVNCVGVMGAGVALAFKQRYPKMFDEYAKECALKRIRPGKPHVWKNDDFFNSAPVTIINFPTKDHWRESSKYEYIEDGLTWLKGFLADKPNQTITVPALGCGHGGLDWDVVKPMIAKYLKDSPADVRVFEPASSLNQNVPEAVVNELKKNDIIKLSPSDPLFPAKLKGTMATDLYIKGDLSGIDRHIISIIIDSKAEEREKSAILKCLDVLEGKDVILLMGFSSSFEIDVVKSLLVKKIKVMLAIPYGILTLKVRKDLQPYWDEKMITLISVSEPTQTWKASESVKAFKFRLKVSDAILIANYNFGALEKFEKDFKAVSTLLFYINYWSDKISFYDRIRAKQIGRNKVTSQPNLTPLFNL